MNKQNVIVALILGSVIGFVVGRVTATPGAPGAPRSAKVASAGSDKGKTPADLPAKFLKEADLSMVSFAGLDDQQKYSLLKAANDMTCDCGCAFGSIAECRKKDPNCPNSPKVIEQMLGHIRAGKSADDTVAAIRAGEAKPAPAAAAAQPPRPAAEDPNTVYKVPVGNAFVKGPKDAPVTIIAFSDFQCPFCSRVLPTFKQIEETYGKKVRVAFKHNPLPFHPDAPLAAEAAMAAGDQGKFWEMHDKLFADTQKLKRPDLEKYAQDLGLNMKKFKDALDSGKYKSMWQADQQEAQKLGARGTPSFFINGRKLRGAQPFPAFQTVIDEELKKADTLVARGIRGDKLYEEMIKDGVEAPPAPTAAAAAPAPAVKKIEVGDAPVKGPKHAKVTIVEWSEFQCPFCSRVGPTLKQIQDTYGKDVRIAFKHQPLPFHNNAMAASEAAEAAKEQGKFWEMHDLLFANQGALDRPSLEKYAQQLGLNMGKFKKALDENTYKSRVQADSAAGMAVGANGTPTFFINGKLLSGAQPFENFKGIIDAELKRADEMLQKGVKMEELYDKLMAEAAAAPAPVVQVAAAEGPVQNIPLVGAPMKGDPKAPVTIVEFSDFQCPFCSRVNPTLAQLMDQYKGKVKVAFKNNPLPFHPQAIQAAEAGLAAHEQGKFWEMHDKLFQNTQTLNRPDLDRYAQELGLNMKKFKDALDSGKYKAQVDADLKLAQSVGVSGTPTFFVNGNKLVGAQPFEQFKTAVDAELQKVAKK